MAFPERFSNLPDYAFPRLRKLSRCARARRRAHCHDHRRAAPPDARISSGRSSQPTSTASGSIPPNDGTPELAGARSPAGSRAAMAWSSGREPADGAERHARGAVQRGHRAVPGDEERQAAGGADAEPVLSGLCRGRADRGGGAGLCARHRGDRLPAGLRQLAADVLDRMAIAYLCSPANPQGAVAVARLSGGPAGAGREARFPIVLADECYSEIWRARRPPACWRWQHAMGADPERVFVFHSLSKRSNLPGLRSGFVAGGPKGIAAHPQAARLCRCAAAPAAAARGRDGLGGRGPCGRPAGRCIRRSSATRTRSSPACRAIDLPDGGFFLWLPVEDGEAAALKLWRETGVRVLPGAYLSRDVDGDNPGKGYIRVALVAPQDETQRGLTRLRDCLYG